MGEIHNATIELVFDDDDDLQTLQINFAKLGPVAGKLNVEATFKYQGDSKSYDWGLYQDIWQDNIVRFLTVKPSASTVTTARTGSFTFAFVLYFAASAFLTLKDYKDFRESVILLSSDLRRAGEFLAKLVKKNAPPP
jgi:hypothetical protein